MGVRVGVRVVVGESVCVRLEWVVLVCADDLKQTVTKLRQTWGFFSMPALTSIHILTQIDGTRH